MAKPFSKRVREIIQRELIEGTIYRVDIDRVDVSPTGSPGIIRSLPLSGDIDKVKVGDPVKVVQVASNRIALAADTVLGTTETDTLAVENGSGDNPAGWGEYTERINGMISFNDLEGDPVDTDTTAAADGVSPYAARRDHRHHMGAHTHAGGDITSQVSDSARLGGVLASGYAPVSHMHTGTQITSQVTDSAKLGGYSPKPTGADAHVPVTDSLGNLPDDEWRLIAGATYSSAGVIQVPGAGSADLFPKGTKVRLKQSSTTKYFYVSATTQLSTYSSVTLIAGTEYTLANATIDELAYSHAQTPVGFPEWFAFTPTWTAASVNPSLGNGTFTCRFKMDGSSLRIVGKLLMGSTTTYGTGNWAFSLPAPCSSAAAFQYLGSGLARRPATATYPMMFFIGGGEIVLQYIGLQYGTPANTSALSATVPITWQTSDYLEFDITYRV